MQSTLLVKTVGGREESPSQAKRQRVSDLSGYSPDLGWALHKVLNKAFISLQSACFTSCYNWFSQLSPWFWILDGASAPLSQVSYPRREPGTEPRVCSLSLFLWPSTPWSSTPALLSNTVNLQQQPQKSLFPSALSFESKNIRWRLVLDALPLSYPSMSLVCFSDKFPPQHLCLSSHPLQADFLRFLLKIYSTPNTVDKFSKLSFFFFSSSFI